MALQPQQIQLSDEQRRLIDQQLFGDIPQAPQINDNVQQMIDQQRARDLQTQQMQSYFEPRDYQQPQNFREGAANVFQQVLLNPIKESLGLRESPEDRYTRYKTAEAQAGLQLAQEQRLRQMQARQVASQMLPGLSQEDQQAFALAELTTPGSGLQALRDNQTQTMREFEEYQRMTPQERQLFEAFRSSAASRTNINNVPNAYKSAAAKQALKRSEAITESARTARRGNAVAMQMKDLLDAGLQTGFGSELMMQLGRVALALGLDDSLGITAGRVAGAEAFTAMSNSVIIPQVKQLGFNPTDADLKFIVRGSPTLAKTPEGNQILLDTLIFNNERATMLDEAQAQYFIDNADGFETNPLLEHRKMERYLMQLSQSDEYVLKRNELQARTVRLLSGADYADDDAAQKALQALRNPRASGTGSNQ